MKNQVLTCLLVAVLAFAGPASLVSAQDSPAPAAPPAAPGTKNKWGEVFVIRRNDAGESVCRAATREERERMTARLRSGRSVLIYPGGRRADKGGSAGPEMLTTSTGQQLLPSAGLQIVLHATPRLSANATVRDAFITAANRWEARISTQMTVVIDVDFGPDFFEQEPFGEDVLGATASARVSRRYSTVRQQLLAAAPTAQEATLYNSLPATSVPVELDGATLSASTVRLTAPAARALGLEPNITNPEQLPIGSGDAGIGFNDGFPFDFNPNDGIDTDKHDFDAVVVHEIGHALGFSSDSGDDSASPLALLDLFRVRPGTVSAGNLATFGTARRVMSEGGTQVYFNNRLNRFGSNELQLATGGPDGVGGDGDQSSHWKDDGATVPFIGIMDPSLPEGVREVMDANDLLAFDSFGYKIDGPPVAPPAPPPVQRPANDNFANAITLQGASGSVAGDNFDATRQAGEPDPSHDPEGIVGNRSVWYRWTATANGTVTMDTIGSDYDTTLGAYTGGGVTALTPAPDPAPNDDEIGPENDDIEVGIVRTSRISFIATAGTTYHIMVNGWRSDTGSFKLNWTAPGAPPPPTSTFQFSKASYSAPEHDRSVGVIVTRTGVTSAQQTVSLNVPPGFDGPFSGQVTFLPGETLKIVPITYDDDQTAEPNTVVNLSLQPLTTGTQVGTPGSATLTITDDDTFPANHVEFSGTALRTVGEGEGRIELTVTRVADAGGNLSQDAFVDYRTDPLSGTALDTKDYIFAAGTLHFLPGETSKTISILINDDFFDESNTESFNVFLSNPLRTRTFSANSHVSIDIVDDDPPGLTTNPNDLTADFVTQHYRDFLNRAPDAGGLAFWSEGIEACGANASCRQGKRRDTSAAFFLSIEFQETGYLVYRMYKAAYGDIDPPTNVPVPVRFREFMTDSQEMARGIVVGPPGWDTELEANKQAVILDFVSRGRFKAEHPPELTPAQFVDALNRHAGNVLSAAERTAAIGEFGGAATSANAGARARALRRVADDQTLRDQEFRRAFVLMQYFGYLRRDPDAGQDVNFNGFFFWLGKLNDNNGDFRRAEMVRAFIESIEYRQRFGQ